MKPLLSFFLGVAISSIAFVSLKSNSPLVSSAQKNNQDTSRRAWAGIHNMLMDPETAKRYHKNFQRNNSSSNTAKVYSIFFGKEAIAYMGKYFQNAADTIEGVRVFYMNYDKPMPEIGVRDTLQTSIFFVPENTKHEILWEEWTSTKNSFKAAAPKFDVVNHGELCPNSCH